VEDIQQHEILVGHCGTSVEVANVRLHEPTERELTWLRVNSTLLVVTSDHRIMVPRGNEQQTIPAGHLRVDDVVLCADGEHRIDEIEHGTQHVEVYQLFFNPDVAIETFYTMDPAILTKGSKLRTATTRRSGMSKDQKKASGGLHAGRHLEGASIPSTYDPWK
jgi:hypothetical protein